MAILRISFLTRCLMNLRGPPGWELSGCREFPNPAPDHPRCSAVTLRFSYGLGCLPVCIAPWRCVHTLWGATHGRLWCKNEVSAPWDRRGSPHPGLGAGLRGRGPDPSPRGRGGFAPRAWVGGKELSCSKLVGFSLKSLCALVLWPVKWRDLWLSRRGVEEI